MSDPVDAGRSAPHGVTLDLPPDRARSALSAAAESWGAVFDEKSEGGRLRLPVLAGLRRGVLEGDVRVTAAGRGSRIEFQVDREQWHVQRAPLAILLLGAAGGVVGLLWPLFPGLIRLVPVGLILALCAWFLVISRLQTSGPEDFLGTVVEPPEETADG